jgi:hypothetical protein
VGHRTGKKLEEEFLLWWGHFQHQSAGAANIYDCKPEPCTELKSNELPSMMVIIRSNRGFFLFYLGVTEVFSLFLLDRTKTFSVLFRSNSGFFSGYLEVKEVLFYPCNCL